MHESIPWNQNCVLPGPYARRVGKGGKGVRLILCLTVSKIKTAFLSKLSGDQ